MTIGTDRRLVGRPGLDAQIRDHLGQRLGGLYGSLIESAPPASLLDLIAKLTDILTAREDEETRAFRDGVVAVLPKLRAFAVSMTRDPHRADDLVQETVLKALRYSDRFEPGTNLQGWLFTILRNEFRDGHRRRRWEIEDADGAIAAKVAVPAEQDAKAEHHDLLAAMAKLPPEQREALVLVGAEGISYEGAAEICGVAVGTIKSRVSRARNRLAALLSFEGRSVPG